MQYHLSYGKRITSGRSRPSFPKLKSKQAKQQARLSPKKPIAKSTKTWYPPDVKTEQEKKFYGAVSLKGVGGYSEELVNGNHTLAVKHWERVKQFVKKHPLKVRAKKSEAEAWLKKAIMTPEQEVVMWSEASMRAPLSHEGYEKYMTAFEQVVGKEQFKSLLGGDAAHVVEEAKKAQKKMEKMYGG